MKQTLRPRDKEIVPMISNAAAANFAAQSSYLQMLEHRDALT